MDNQSKEILMLMVDRVPELPEGDREKILWLMNRLIGTVSIDSTEVARLMKGLTENQNIRAMGFLEGMAAGNSRTVHQRHETLTTEEKFAILQMVAELPPRLKDRALGFMQGLTAAAADAGRSASQPEQAEKEKEEAPANA